MNRKTMSVVAGSLAIGIIVLLALPIGWPNYQKRRAINPEKLNVERVIEALVAYNVDFGDFELSRDSVESSMKYQDSEALLNFSRRKDVVFNFGKDFGEHIGSDWIMMNFKYVDRDKVIVGFGDSHAETIDMGQLSNIFDN